MACNGKRIDAAYRYECSYQYRPVAGRSEPGFDRRAPKENRYAYIICKVYRTYEDGNKEWPVQYLLALNIRINGKIHFIDSSFGSNEELGDIRKNVLRIMSCGRLQRVKFRYTGPDVDAALDRLPTAEITDEDEDGYTISAEVFGKGIDMWFRSQGDYIKVIEGGDGR